MDLSMTSIARWLTGIYPGSLAKPKSREPVVAEMRGKKGLAGGKRVEKEEGKKVYLEVFLLDLNDDSDRLRVDLDHVSELELAERVDASGHVRAELLVPRQHLQLVHRQVGEQHHHVFLKTDES